MAFIIFFLKSLKKFEKVEKTGIISTNFLLRCTPSLILGVNIKKVHVRPVIYTVYIIMYINQIFLATKKFTTPYCSFVIGASS